MKRIRLNRSATASTIIIIKLLVKISIFFVEFDEDSPFTVYIFYITTLKVNGQHKIIESIQL